MSVIRIKAFKNMVQDRIYNYFERNPQLHVLFIFDRMNIIQNELDEIKQWNDDYIYKVFDGAWFNAKYAIENDWKDKHVVLLFPEQVYPHTEEQQLSFPRLFGIFLLTIDGVSPFMILVMMPYLSRQSF